MRFDVSQISSLLIALLVVFLIYRRLRRSFGQQLLSPVRMRVRCVVLLVVAGLLLPGALTSAASLAAALAGVLAGVALALWGAAHTRFLRASGRLYYVPHTYTGIAVSLLFLGRLVYRGVQAYGSSHAAHAVGQSAANPAQAASSML